MHDSDSDLIAACLPVCLSCSLSGVLDRLDRSTCVDSVGFGISVRRLFIIIYHESHLLKITNLRVPLLVLRIYSTVVSR